MKVHVRQLSVLVIISLFITKGNAVIQCISQDGKPVDWFIVYKLPKSHENIPVDSFYYMDVAAPTWRLSDKTMDSPGHAVYNTLNQIYKSSNWTGGSSQDLMYLMYNDKPADSHEKYSSIHGHTKGVVSFDSDTGFWLVHSTPKFPPKKSDGYSWPSSAEVFGQTFLCISMKTGPNIDNVGKQLQFNYPDIYDKAMPTSMKEKYKEMASAFNGMHPKDPPYNRKVLLTSLAGTKFTSFAKFSKFNADLYSAWLAPEFQDSLLVETWQNGINPLCSNCTGPYKVYDVSMVMFKDVEFRETRDHAKWAVSQNNTWTCIGDINRQRSQMMRAGGTVCFQNKSVWKSFHDIVNGYDACGRQLGRDNCVRG